VKTLNLKMRDSSNYFQHGGRRGDHRMVKLVISLPKERLEQKAEIHNGLDRRIVPRAFRLRLHEDDPDGSRGFIPANPVLPHAAQCRL